MLNTLHIGRALKLYENLRFYSAKQTDLCNLRNLREIFEIYIGH